MTSRRGSSKGKPKHRGLLEIPAARPLLETVDHGDAVSLDEGMLGASSERSSERWVEPFLRANRSHLQRLGVTANVETRNGLEVRLTPGSRIGAVPLISPATRRVAAGLLIKPRFAWSALGAVLGDIGFATEPTLGGTPLVPGSARQVPAWLLAAPVVRRLEAFLRHRKRGFSEREEVRQSPRGRVDWTRWATRHVPSGRWATLPCHFSEPGDDPELMAGVRWTLGRLDEELATFHEAIAARLLRTRISTLQTEIGTGHIRRPSTAFHTNSNEWLAEAAQAMGWVSEERGLGGAQTLDGMSWDLPIDEVWEAWVDAFIADLAPRCGLNALRRGQTTRQLNWTTGTKSMRMLIPDSGLRGNERLVWVDAKYKSHLQNLADQGWFGLGDTTRDAHRADLHQALAYAALGEAERVDSLLVYPDLSAEARRPPAIATVASGRRHVRLILVGLPFGFRSPAQREETLADWRNLLVA